MTCRRGTHPSSVRSPGRPVRAAAVALLLLGAPACGAVEYDLTSLARLEPLPYSVLVTGGVYLEAPAAAPGRAASTLDRTFAAAEATDAPEPPAAVEVVPLDAVMQVLEGGRVFVRAVQDHSPTADRQRWSQNELFPGDRQVEALLAQARRDGHDLVLVVERLRDGPVASQGINGRWPVTLVAWLAVGLGLVIPDHTYESAATLGFSLRDVQSGEVLVRAVRSAGAVDLSLVERADLLGIVASILVPPFLVWDDDPKVVDSVREVSQRRMLVSLAGRLKEVATQREIHEGQAARLEVRPAADGIEVVVTTGEGLAAVRVRVDGELLDEAATAGDWARIQASVTAVGDSRLRYSGVIAVPGGADTVQVVVQTLTGRLAASTLRLGREGR